MQRITDASVRTIIPDVGLSRFDRKVNTLWVSFVCQIYAVILSVCWKRCQCVQVFACLLCLFYCWSIP